MDMVKFVIFGAIVGVANIIPGVSGGTMAVILKIYDRLIETLSLKNVKKNLPFTFRWASARPWGSSCSARPSSSCSGIIPWPPILPLWG